MATSKLDALSINTIRTLSIDAIEKANSGHPGLPMGAAPMAYVLFTRFMRHNPQNTAWFNRDRFVLSAGHGSMLLYSLLHLCQYDLTLEDLKQFRQWGSRTPGHPEYHHTAGVETTTGPLGQGFASAVGMAMAERHLASRFNQEGFPVIDHDTYVLCGDGDLMEGISYEAASLAGHLGLDRLIVLYDSNDISLDGPTTKSFTENVKDRFLAANWNYLRVEDGNDLDAIAKAIAQAKATKGKPTIIEVRTVIGYGSPGKQGTNAAHGSPLGEKEVALAKAAYEWQHEPFYVPEEVKVHFADAMVQASSHETSWNNLIADYEKAYPELGQALRDLIAGKLPEGWEEQLPYYPDGSDGMATRQASGKALNALAATIPTFLGGSADLAGSNETTIKGEAMLTRDDYSGRNLWFGVREHAMGAMLNGLALHGGLHVYGGTFLVFSDYLRPSIRLASLMKLPVIYVFTHDSIGVGEDGPTHQPVEHVAALRIIPNLVTFRPADANETTAAWQFALAHRDRPVALALTRQKLPILPNSFHLAKEGTAKGGYVLAKERGETIDAILLATGSEVSLALEAKNDLEANGLSIRVVSLPSWRLFDEQTDAYRESVLPHNVTTRVAIEMLHPFGWEKYTGFEGAIIGIDHFGASAPAGTLMKEFGITKEAIISAVNDRVQRG